MRNDNDKKLEELIHRELSRLPQRSAPETLVPRVMQAIQARRQRKWWQRPWTKWPLALQIASLPVLCLGAAAMISMLSLAGGLSVWQQGLEAARQMAVSLAPVWEFAVVLLNGCLLAAQALSDYWVLFLGGLAASVSVAFLGVGTLCFRLAATRH